MSATNAGSLLLIAGVDKWDLEINGITLFEKDGKRWINFPSKEYMKDGQKKYAPTFRFRDKKNFEKFCEVVKAEIDKKISTVQEDSYDPTQCF